MKHVAPESVTVLVFSDDAQVRQQVKSALGHRIRADLPELIYVEVATAPVVLQKVAEANIDIAILDGEAAPYGGLGIAKQLKDESKPCPPIVVLTGRAEDTWLARWSGAEVTVSRPIDPRALANAVSPLMPAAAQRITVATSAAASRLKSGDDETDEQRAKTLFPAAVSSAEMLGDFVDDPTATNPAAASAPAAPPPMSWDVKVARPNAFAVREVVPYVQEAFGSIMSTAVPETWRGEVFEQRTQRTDHNGHTTELAVRVAPRKNKDGEYEGCRVRLHETGIADPAARRETLRELEGELTRLDGFFEAALKLRQQTRQAIVIVHGIGEQMPTQTLRKFTTGVFGEPDKDQWFLKPDYISSLFETRTTRITANTFPGMPRTDVYELYWAHLIRDTTLGQVYGWLLRLLVAPNRNIPAALKKHFWGARIGLGASVVAAVIIWVLMHRVGHPAPPPPATATRALWSTATLAAAVAALPTLGWAALRLIQQRFLLGFLGDAARYLEPRPGNVKRRQEIREAGVQLLNGLHDDARKYSRIVVFGHSLGSVIAYDILSLTWARRFLDYDKKSANIMTSRALTRLEDLLNPRGAPPPRSISEIRDRQFAAWEEYRRNGIRWLVSDFVTAGSPLTSAALLLNLDKKTPFDGLVKDRSFPSCPPQTEPWPSPDPKRDRLRFTFTHAYPDPGNPGRTRSVDVPHYSALFGPVRWTNLYFRMRGVMGGDPIGGPLEKPFGCWIDDVEMPSPRGGPLGFAHNLYWKPMGDDAHIRRLREALALPFHGGLDALITELYAQYAIEYGWPKPIPDPVEAYRFMADWTDW